VNAKAAHQQDTKETENGLLQIVCKIASRYVRALLPSRAKAQDHRGSVAGKDALNQWQEVSSFIRCNQWPFSHVARSHSLGARAHSCYDIGQTGRFREDDRIIERWRPIVRGAASQHNERLAALAQFPRDRLACLAALTSRTAISHLGSSKRTSSHLRPAFTAFVCVSLQKFQRNSPPPLVP
jgi:hypothetical protein